MSATEYELRLLIDRFVFTIQSLTSESEDEALADGGTIGKATIALRALVASGGLTYVVGALERGDSTGRLHLQGYLKCKERHRMGWVIKRLIPTAYVRPQKALDSSVARKYAMGLEGPEYVEHKEGFVRIHLELGTWEETKPGKRSDLAIVRDAIEAGDLTTFDDVNAVHPGVAARNLQWVKMTMESKASRDSMELERKTMASFKPRVWQHWLARVLNETEPDDRKIIFVVDKVGGAGKSKFCNNYKLNCASNGRRCDYIRPSKKQDMAEGLDLSADVLFIDIPRGCKAEFIAHVYVFLEEVKDGRVMAPKYFSRVKTFKPPHVVVFMNIDVDVGGKLLEKPKPFDRNNGTRAMQLEDVEYTEAPLTFDRYRIWKTDKKRDEWSVDHFKWGTTVPPFMGFTETMQPMIDRVVLAEPTTAMEVEELHDGVPTFGPEFQGDNAGDGPSPARIGEWTDTYVKLVGGSKMPSFKSCILSVNPDANVYTKHLVVAWPPPASLIDEDEGAYFCMHTGLWVGDPTSPDEPDVVVYTQAAPWALWRMRTLRYGVRATNRSKALVPQVFSQCFGRPYFPGEVLDRLLRPSELIMMCPDDVLPAIHYVDGDQCVINEAGNLSMNTVLHD